MELREQDGSLGAVGEGEEPPQGPGSRLEQEAGCGAGVQAKTQQAGPRIVGFHQPEG